jgi:hypothetical protein
MNDDDMLSLVRDRMTRARDDLGSVHMEEPASAVLHRARSRRMRHRLYGAAAGTGVLGVALAVGLGAVSTGGTAGAVATGSPSSPSSASSASGASATQAVHVNLDAWSVNTAVNGTVELTIKQLRDKAELEKTLAAAGIPAVVNFGEVCRAADGSNPSGIRKVLGISNGQGVTSSGGITIHPAAIPSGDELAIDTYGANGKESGPFLFAVGLVPRGTAVTCSDPVKTGTTK